MAGRFFRFYVRGALPFTALCGVVFAALLTALLVVEKPEKVQRNIEKRIAEGKSVPPHYYVPVWLYRGLQMNVALAALLLAGSPWLGGKAPQGMTFLRVPGSTGLRRWELMVCAGLMGVAAWHHAPRLWHGMWGDEEFNASRYILNSFERGEDDRLVEEERPWVTTLWNMRKPTNHLGYSVFARLSHEAFFKPGLGPRDPWFSEAWLRAPVFTAGLLMIPALVWALQVWGISGWWAVLFLLLHPWYLRFGVDGRGYGPMMLTAVFLMGAAGRALQTGAWRWWCGLGVGCFVAMWCNLQGAYLVAAVQMMVAAGLLAGRLDWKARGLLFRRWVVAGMLTGFLTLGWLAPCWPQLLEFLAQNEISGDMDRKFFADVFCAWFFGQPWWMWDQPDNPLRYAMELSMRWLPAWHWVGIAGFVVALLAGLLRLGWRRERWPLLIFAVGAPGVMLLHMAVSHTRPYDWYLSPFVPGLLALLAAGLASAGRRGWMLVPGVALLVTYGLVTREPRRLFRDHAVEPSRESVASYRAVTNPRHADIDKEVISGGFTMYTEGYDPVLRRFRDVQGLRELMAEADRSGRQLYVNLGNLEFLREAEGTAPVTALLLDNALFEKTGRFYGLLPYTTRDVFRYRGAGTAGETGP